MGLSRDFFGGTKHYSPDSVGTCISQKHFSSIIPHSIFGTKVTRFKIGDDKKKCWDVEMFFSGVFHMYHHPQFILSFEKLDIYKVI